MLYFRNDVEWGATLQNRYRDGKLMILVLTLSEFNLQNRKKELYCELNQE